MLNFFEDKIKEFSPTLTDYLTTLEKPLAALIKMCPYKMATDNSEWLYNEDLSDNAIYYMEKGVNDILAESMDSDEQIKPNDSVQDFNSLTKGEIIDLLKEYDRYIQDANDENRYSEGWFPVCINEFYDNEYQAILEERAALVIKEAAPLVIPEGAFAFGGYHFTPYRSFCKGEIERPLDGDSRPQKTDVQYAMRNMHTDRDMGLSTYSWGKADYTFDTFYAASCGSRNDIFRCVENGKLYVPHENELFQYKEPSNAEKAEQAMKIGRVSYSAPSEAYPISAFLISDTGKGTWLKIPTGAEDLHKALINIGAEDGKYAIAAVKGILNSIEELLPTASGIDELNMLGCFLKKMESWQLNKLDGVLQSGIANINNVAGIVNILYEDNFDGINWIAVFDTEELGRYWASEEPDAIMEGMSFDDYGKQCAEEEKGRFTDYGYMYVKSTPQVEYAGIVPEQYRIAEAAITLKAREPRPRTERKSLLGRLDDKKHMVKKKDASRTGQKQTKNRRERSGNGLGN